MRYELTLALQHMMSRKLISGLITIILIVVGLLYILEFSLLFHTEHRITFLVGMVPILMGIFLKILVGKLQSGRYSNILRVFFFLSAILLVLLAPSLGIWTRVAYILGPYFFFMGTIVEKPAKNKPSESRLISIISVITILGVVLGVMALIMVIAVMDGAQEDYKERLLNQYAHIEVHAPFGQRISNYQILMDLIAEDPDVKAVSPMLKHYGLLKFADDALDLGSSQPSQIFGIDPDLEAKVSVFGLENEHLIGKRAPGDDEIVVGSEIARRMRLSIGDELVVVTGKVVPLSTGMHSVHQHALKVAGMFTTGLYEVDLSVSYVSIPTSQAINLLVDDDQDQVDLVHMKLTDPLLASRVEERLKTAIWEKLGVLLVIRTWEKMNPDFFVALKLEKLVMFIILMLVIVVAGMNIIGTLILVTMEKTREIGILRAIGTPRRSISLIFILEGGLIGVIGTTIGLVFGLLGCHYLQHYVPVEIPEAVYMLDGIPVLVKASTVFIIVLCSMGVCLLSSVIPATLAARLNIVEALRYE